MSETERLFWTCLLDCAADWTRLLGVMNQLIQSNGQEPIRVEEQKTPPEFQTVVDNLRNAANSFGRTLVNGSMSQG